MAASPPRGALAGLRAGAMSGAASVALSLGALLVLMLLGGSDVGRALAASPWLRQAVIAAGVGAGAGVVLGGLAGALLGRLGEGPMVAAIVGGALALTAATVFYLLGLHARVHDVVVAGLGAASVGGALGVLLWLPFAAYHGLAAKLRR